MNSLLTPSPRLKPVRQRKTLLPVQVHAELYVGTDPSSLPDDLANGVAMLTIRSGDATDQDTRRYWVRFLFSHGNAYAVQLTRFGSREVYLITLADERCDCPDSVYAADRPGGCKHVVALRQVLPTVGKAGAA
jgi:hypothetical protein